MFLINFLLTYLLTYLLATLSVCAAQPDISATKPDTYVIINGVRQRVTDDVSGQEHESVSGTANQRRQNTASLTHDQGTQYMNHRSSVGCLKLGLI